MDGHDDGLVFFHPADKSSTTMLPPDVACADVGAVCLAHTRYTIGKTNARYLQIRHWQLRQRHCPCMLPMVRLSFGWRSAWESGQRQANATRRRSLMPKMPKPSGSRLKPKLSYSQVAKIKNMEACACKRFKHICASDDLGEAEELMQRTAAR